MKTDISRKDIYLINKYSNVSRQNVQKTFDNNIYADKYAWQKFLNILFISLGVGLMTAGVLFFFAYNWADLNKFIKLSLIGGLILCSLIPVIFTNTPILIKKIIITVSSVLVGVLFAVFGQIYQTGANAYDFFLGWTIFVTLWVIVTNFAPLWLIFVVLLNTMLHFYSDQVTNWSEYNEYGYLLLLNAIILILFHLYNFLKGNLAFPTWLTKTQALLTLNIATSIVSMNIVGFEKPYIFFFFLSIIMIAIDIIWGFKVKSIFHLAIGALAVVIIICCLILRTGIDTEKIFLTGFFVIASISGVVKLLLSLQNKWKDEK